MKKQLSNYRSKMIAMLMMVMVVSVSWAQEREKRDVSGFNELSISSAFVVEIRVGNTESLEIEAEARFMDDIITEVRGGKLVIRIKDSRETRRMKKDVRAYLTVKSLDKIHATGAVKITTLDVLKGDDMTVELSGASKLDMEVDVNELYVQGSGACTINIAGRADDQTMKSSGATNYRAFELKSKTADIRVNGAGTAHISVSDRLDVRASGASSIRYKGQPSIDMSTSGASSVRSAN